MTSRNPRPPAIPTDAPSRARLLARAAGLAVTVASLFAPSSASASGMWISDRGVRPLGRGGAFVAGADDLGSIAYNPAGLAEAGTALLLDASLVNVRTNFTRRAIVNDSAGNPVEQSFPTATGTTPPIPIPTIAGSYSPAFGDHMFTFAGGVYAPYAALSKFPETVDGQPAASRYSLVSLEGSALVVIGGYVAFKPVEELRIGVGLETLTGSLETKTVFSASPRDRLLAAAESTEFDTPATQKTKLIIAPRAHFGVTVVPRKDFRLGASFQTPSNIDVPADLNVTFPRSVTFDNARQEGSGIRVKTVLPAVLRLGLEVRPVEDLRIEAAWVYEMWKAHEELAITPGDLKFYDITGFPSPIAIPPVAIPRHFQNSSSFRLGGEYSVINAPNRIGLDVRSGVAYETSAIPNDYLTPLSADLDRLVVAIGVGVKPTPRWRLDVLYAHVFAFAADADPRTAKVSPINPVRGNPTVPTPINGGTYSAAANIFGLGATVKF